ncbi:cytochrome P450 monooxygenase pc-2 [Gloeophyllum trabeum ATCC 11539]|uniref:Cytochrome P450 monooxygenase pc-2 n=1 Tax=Gloeophyllum trabeum (strain ATCC 11539 / FP-39264 / Madison 617) TaxID=670483 RepID=S7RRI0_GLOTA|nr:cytochrome P450 monooxygenase pc-2 [Gloeophyllum trabeum ATCC 11539]EPQ55554.1 cytochrome P450 monooxygenase pc-2 [Gloeophyllum trabeum ATCC 11539]
MIVVCVQSWNKRRDAERMGARLVPVWNGRWPGNVDHIVNLIKLVNSGYPGEYFLRAWPEVGKVFNTRVLWEDIILTVEPDHVKVILATDFNSFVKGDKQKYKMESLLGTGVFNSDGRRILFHRSMTRPFFSRDRIAHFDIFDRHGEEAIEKIKQRQAEGYPVDFQDLISRFTLDSATDFLFGSNVNSLSDVLPYPYGVDAAATVTDSPVASPPGSAEAKRFAGAFAEAQDVIARRFNMGEIWPLSEIGKDKTKEPMKVVSGYIDRILEEALAKTKAALPLDTVDAKVDDEAEDGETLLEHLIKFTSDRKILKDETLNILLAGRDTTAATLTFVIYFLAMYPNVMARLRSEVLDKVGPTRKPTYDDIREMKYLRAVINETLRLYPAVPFNVRQSVRATTLPSPNPGQKPFYVPANTSVTYSVFLMHRRKDLWGPDADDFDPDRFIDDRLRKYLTPNPFIFVPFNAGPRICLGQQFAYNEMSFMLIRLLQNFSSIELEPSAHAPGTLPPKEWAKAEGRQAIERFCPKSHLTMYSRGGLWVRMTEVNKEDIIV